MQFSHVRRRLILDRKRLAWFNRHDREQYSSLYRSARPRSEKNYELGNNPDIGIHKLLKLRTEDPGFQRYTISIVRYFTIWIIGFRRYCVPFQGLCLLKAANNTNPISVHLNIYRLPEYLSGLDLEDKSRVFEREKRRLPVRATRVGMNAY